MGKFNNKRGKTALQALTASAMALPAFQAVAATAPTEHILSYRYSQYAEDDAPVSRVVTGSKDRYKINIQQLSILVPMTEEFSLSVDILTETLSGASPIGTTANAAGEPQLIMSGASISEDREDVTAHVSHYGEFITAGITAGVSTENDYQASYYGFDWEWEFNQKNTAILLSSSRSNDTLTPTDAVAFGRIPVATKTTYTENFGLSQVLSKNNIVQFVMGFSTDTGYLSDPYKIGDIRPNARSRKTISLRYRHYFTASKAALHLDYRNYRDSWNISSHTFGFSWQQNLQRQFQLIPSWRYYSQTEASFYEPFKVAANTNPFYSSDYRLSPYGALSVGLKLVHKIKNWSYTVSVERYQASAGFSFKKVKVENPALISYTLMTLGIDFKF